MVWPVVFLAPGCGFVILFADAPNPSHFQFYSIVCEYLFMEAVFTGNPVCYVGKIGSLFSPKLRVHIKDNNTSSHGKFHRFLFPFSNKFPDLKFVPYVLYINRK